MTCDEIRALYLDRDLELPDVEAAVTIAAHLGQCQACRQAAGEYDQLRALLSAPEHDVSEDVEADELRLPGFDLVKPLRPASRERFRALRPMTYAALAIVAIIGWGLYFAHRHNNPGGPQLARSAPTDEQAAKGNFHDRRAADDAGPVVPVALRWTPADVDRGAALFSKVSESFDGRAAWVAVGDRASDLGLIDGPSAPPPKVLLVRLLMSHAQRSPSKTDLVIVPGQEVSVEIPFQDDEVLRYRIKTTPGPQPRLTLAAEVRSLGRGEILAALATQLQPQAGQALSAGRLLSQSGPYSLDVSFSETALPAVQ